MSKYSLEFKLEVVKYCLEENHSFWEAARKFNMNDKTNVKYWCRKYMTHGIEGLKKNAVSSYDGNFKKYVVEYMHANHLSASETAIKFNLSYHGIVLKWEQIYYEEGPQALFEEQRGMKRKMKSKPKNKKIYKNEKELLAEIEQLRMENEYLKKLNALVQERIKRENKKK